MTTVLLWLAAGYLIGSIPFGYLLIRMAGLGDIRAIGSGAIGATNVLRTGRKGIAALTVVLDIGKGTLAALLASRMGDPVLPLVAGSAAVLGHCTSVWMRGRGGKGVATALGAVIAWSWPAALVCAGLWLATAVLTRRSSAASLVATIAAAPLLLALATPAAALAALLVAVLIVARHHANIRRLLAGTEPRIGAGA